MRFRWRVRTRTLLFFVAIAAGMISLAVRSARTVQVVGAPDLVDVQVRLALPDRPITGPRLVLPDGTIRLGYYGRVRIAGLTPDEVKAAVVVHLRRYLSDETLGLVGPAAGAGGRRAIPRRISPFDTDRVSIKVVARNSRRPNLIDRIILRMRIPEVMGLL